ncbi:relaxase/mobilization nuclease domain-containing protein [Brenneria tiliae]|uniref:Relaxase/mobilization nuclease domain-containing protein n=1 Tax=Brenneria tiliae TaxID=2914984 RepID=A0ABT0MTN3_9GAMM|nr:relaxase/mobilization nuclease domain-containing protein [Brenneria tiliae]MCL2893211.1 relaxase/mobilization nuclease domain-containing protein [Brenneria tiliae]
MKGMQKIKRGKSFAGVVLYALRSAPHHKTPPLVIGGNMEESSAKDLIAEFNATKALRPDVLKAVWHNSLRLPKNEALTNPEWAIIADDYMARMGFSETHLRCYVLHDDEDGQHIHIIASRIDLSNGSLYLGKNENLISTRIIQQLEIDHHLTKTKRPEAEASPASSSPKSKSKKSRNEAMQEKRTGEQCPKTIIQNALGSLLANKPSITEFVQQLAAHNIKALPNIASTGKMNGFSFEYSGIAFKASQLGKGYSWAELQNKIDYQPERDNAFLFELKASASEAPDIAITPVIAAEDVNSPIESLILDNHAGQDEYVITYPTALHKEAVAINKEAIANEALKESPKRSYTTTAFRWLEAIPYIDAIIGMLKKLKIPTLKRPEKHKTITGVRIVEITPLTPKTTIETPHKSRRASLSM